MVLKEKSKSSDENLLFNILNKMAFCALLLIKSLGVVNSTEKVGVLNAEFSSSSNCALFGNSIVSRLNSGALIL